MKRLLLMSAVTIALATFGLAQSDNGTKVSVDSDSDALAAVKRAIDKGNAQWIEAWEKSDPSMTTSLFAGDGKFLQSSGKIIKGREQLLAWQKTFMTALGKGATVGITTLNVWLDGNTAYEVGKYRYDYQSEGKPAVAEGKYVVIWKKQKDGSWKIFSDMGVPN